MRRGPDVLRSVRRAALSALGSPPYRGMLAADPGRTVRPYLIVNDPDGYQQGRDGIDTDRLRMSVVIYAYPEAGGSPSESKLIASQTAEALAIMLEYGVQDAWAPGVRGYRQRIPLFDYAADEFGTQRPLEGAGSTAPADSRFASDYIAVDDGWSVQTRPEADEGQLFVAVAQLRAQWFRAAGLRSAAAAGAPFNDVRITYGN